MDTQENLGSEQFLRKKENSFRYAVASAIFFFFFVATFVAIVQNPTAGNSRTESLSEAELPPPFDRIASPLAQTSSLSGDLISEKALSFKLPGDVLRFVVAWEEETGPVSRTLFEGFIAAVPFSDLDAFLKVTPRMGEFSRHTRVEKNASEIEYEYHRGPADVFGVLLIPNGTSTILIIRQDIKQ